MTATSTGQVLVVGPRPAGDDAQPAAEDAVLDLVGRVENSRLPGPALVLVHDDRPASQARLCAPGRTREVAIARATLSRDDVALRAVAGPVSRFLLLAEVLRSCDAPAGVLAAGVDVVAAQLRTYALLASVARLEHPTPAVAQHARSLLPGACFLVEDTGVKAVKHRLPRGLGRGAHALLAVSADRCPTEWVDMLWSAVGPATEPPEPVSLAGRSCWGATKWAEITVAPAEPAHLAGDLARRPRMPCPWCGHAVLTELPCPFCGAAARSTPLPPTAQPEERP